MSYTRSSEHKVHKNGKTQFIISETNGNIRVDQKNGDAIFITMDLEAARMVAESILDIYETAKASGQSQLPSGCVTESDYVAANALQCICPGMQYSSACEFVLLARGFMKRGHKSGAIKIIIDSGLTLNEAEAFVDEYLID